MTGQRGIKFRGRRVDNGDWVYGYYVKCRNFIYILPDTTKGGYDERWEDDQWIEVDPETVGQYTNLKDSKRTKKFPEGQKAYEKDIIKVFGGDVFDIVGEIIFDDFQWVIVHEKKTPLCDILYNNLDFEIIGNSLEGKYASNKRA